MLTKLSIKTFWFFVLVFLIISCLFYNFQIKEPINEQTPSSSFTQDTIKANLLIIEAEQVYDEGEYEMAIEKYQAAKAIFTTYQLWDKVVSCDTETAVIADNIDIPTKQNYAYQGLHTAKKYLTKNHFEVGRAYQQVAEVSMMKENYDSSIIYFNAALSIFKQEKKWDFYGWAMISKSVNYYYKNDIKSFKEELLKAQEYVEKYDLDREIYITTLDLLALVYDEAGDFEKAVENTKNSIAYYLNSPKVNNIDSSFISVNYLNIAIFYANMGAYQKANNYMFKGLEFTKSNSTDRELILTQISRNAYAMEDYRKSITYSHHSLMMLPQLQEKGQIEKRTFLYAQISAAFRNLDLLDSSKYYLKLALDNPDNKHIASANIDYARLLLRQQKFDEALRVARKTVGLETIYTSKILLYITLGRAEAEKGNFEEAFSAFQKSLNLILPNFIDTLNVYANPSDFHNIKETMLLLEALKYKAQAFSRFSEQKQNLDAALATYDLAFQFMDTLLQKYAFDDSRIIHNQRNREIYEQAVEVALQLYKQTKEEKYVHKAFTYAEKIKSNILLTELQIDDNQTIIPNRIQEREKDLVANVLFYERQLATAIKDSATAKIKLYQNYLTNYKLDLGELKDSIKDNYPKYYSLKYSSTLATIPIIQTDLKPEQAFISYYSGDSATYVFTLTNDNIVFEKVGKTNTIDEQVFAFRNALKAPNNSNLNTIFESYNQISNQTYQRILANSIDKLSDKVNHLTIIPDGSLNHIPFEILTNKITTTISQDFSKMPYLLFDYQIQYGYSATLLRENKKRQNQIKPNAKCLAYAPIYKDDGSNQRSIASNLRDASTTQLQNTSKEIKSIATYFDGDFNQTKTATKANFLKAAPDFGILHLAMHGEANYEKEKFANLKFSNTKSQSNEDYLLYQGEIANMDLNAQLVVLSACETGVGKYIYGEGIASLGRSFMYAGVPSIVMSLWKVDDKATSQLMPYFYENLAAGMSKDKALHEAKLTFLKKEDFSTLHPHYWAGFVAIGDIQPIKNATNWKYLIFGGLLILVFGIAFFLWKGKS